MSRRQGWRPCEQECSHQEVTLHCSSRVGCSYLGAVLRRGLFSTVLLSTESEQYQTLSQCDHTTVAFPAFRTINPNKT